MYRPYGIREKGGSFNRGFIELGFLSIDAPNAVDFFLPGWAIASLGFVGSIAVAALF
jgi:hypothetical protein